jgi:hypothetical protein
MAFQSLQSHREGNVTLRQSERCLRLQHNILIMYCIRGLSARCKFVLGEAVNSVGACQKSKTKLKASTLSYELQTSEPEIWRTRY